MNNLNKSTSYIFNNYNDIEGRDTYREYSEYFYYHFCNIQSVTICSDGINSYIDKDSNEIDFQNTCSEYTGFKRMNGDFVKSNMLFLKKKMEKQLITHYDDISCATIIKELPK